MQRIPYPPRDALSAAKKQVLADPNRRILNVNRITMHATETVWRAQSDMGRAIMYGCDLDERLREMLIVRVAYISHSNYELFHHLSLARQVGVLEQDLRAIEIGDYALFPANARAMLKFVDEVVRLVSPSDKVVYELRQHFSDSSIIDMVFAIGTYMQTARIVAVTGIECEEKTIAEWPTFQGGSPANTSV